MKYFSYSIKIVLQPYHPPAEFMPENSFDSVQIGVSNDS